MPLTYSRKVSFIFISFGLAIGIPLLMALNNIFLTIRSGRNSVACVFLAVSALIFVRGAVLFLKPPAVLEITAEGIRLYAKSLLTGYTRDAALLPWCLIHSMRLVLLDKKSFLNGGIEFSLTSPPSADVAKRNSGAWLLNDPKRFYINASVLNLPNDEVLSAFEAGLQQWKKQHELATLKI